MFFDETAFQRKACLHVGSCTAGGASDNPVCTGAADAVGTAAAGDPRNRSVDPAVSHLGHRANRHVATLFGTITLMRFLYQPVESAERSIFPLEIRLGLEAGIATPVLIGRPPNSKMRITIPGCCMHHASWTTGVRA